MITVKEVNTLQRVYWMIAESFLKIKIRCDYCNGESHFPPQCGEVPNVKWRIEVWEETPDVSSVLKVDVFKNCTSSYIRRKIVWWETSYFFMFKIKQENPLASGLCE